jgi:endonuclease-3
VKRQLKPAELAALKKRAQKAAQVLAKLYPNEKVFLDHGNPWELLVAVMLSAQSTDVQVNKVTEKLFKKYRKLDDYVQASQAEFEKDIYSTGFYRTKAKNVLAAAKIVKEQFNGKVPRTMEELLTLPGVARKTANIVLQSAYGVVVGIPVDTHVARFAKVYGFSDETDPVKIERDLMMLFPEKEWLRLAYRIVSYGRQYCPARKHDHANCPLAKI